VLAVIVVGGAASCAALAALAAGSIGPGRLGDVGPAAGPVGLAVGAELLVGAAIALFAPSGARRDVRCRTPTAPRPRGRRTLSSTVAAVSTPSRDLVPGSTPDETETAPLGATDLDPLASLGDPDDRPA
jgi:hypothetical protein